MFLNRDWFKDEPTEGLCWGYRQGLGKDFLTG